MHRADEQVHTMHRVRHTVLVSCVCMRCCIGLKLFVVTIVRTTMKSVVQHARDHQRHRLQQHQLHRTHITTNVSSGAIHTQRIE